MLLPVVVHEFEFRRGKIGFPENAGIDGAEVAHLVGSPRLLCFFPTNPKPGNIRCKRDTENTRRLSSRVVPSGSGVGTYCHRSNRGVDFADVSETKQARYKPVRIIIQYDSFRSRKGHVRKLARNTTTQAGRIRLLVPSKT